jgi:hypothetical protein
MIRVKCPGCSKAFKAPAKYAGRRVKCPNCSSPIQLPAAIEPVLESVHPATTPQNIRISAAPRPKTVTRTSQLSLLRIGSKYKPIRIDGGRVEMIALNFKWAVVTTAILAIIVTSILTALFWPSSNFENIAIAKQELEAIILDAQDRLIVEEFQLRSLDRTYRSLWIYSILSAGIIAMLPTAAYPLYLYLEATVRKRITKGTAVGLLSLAGGMAGPMVSYYLGNAYDLIKMRVDQHIFILGGLIVGVAIGLVLGLIHAYVISE